jgi:hypothetical protein
LRTVGRTAVIAGTATAVSGRVARRQNAKFASQEAPDGGGDDPMDQLKKLAELKDQGILTEQEFSDQKAKILAQM